MIYGLNFNGTPIPPGYLRHLRKELRHPNGHRYRLQGVTDRREELPVMLIQANNGKRPLHVVERKTAGPVLFAVYCY